MITMFVARNANIHQCKPFRCRFNAVAGNWLCRFNEELAKLNRAMALRAL
jgi:hypothetical protein